jgi:serine protease Do
VRNGPGTNFGILTAAKKGDTLNLVGQVQNCAWFKVTTADGQTGWVIGGADYVTANIACAALPAAEAPPTPVPPPPAAAAPKQPAPSPRPAGSLVPADKGCILFENDLGVELNVTLNSGGTAENFKVAPMGKYVTCLNPGHYDYTLDAPPPFGSSNGRFDVEAGKQFRFPVQSLP